MIDRNPAPEDIDYSGCHAPELMKAMHTLGQFEGCLRAVPVTTRAGQALRGQITVEIDTIRLHLETMHGIQIGRSTSV